MRGSAGAGGKKTAGSRFTGGVAQAAVIRTEQWLAPAAAQEGSRAGEVRACRHGS